MTMEEREFPGFYISFNLLTLKECFDLKARKSLKMDDAEGYTRTNTITGNDATEVLEAHRRYFRWTEGERILDVGCGSGDVTAHILLPFLPEDSSLVGCDISERMLRSCKKYEIYGRLTFKKLDIQQKLLNNGWGNELFDKIFSFYCLHWVTDHRQAIRNIYSLLKPGGEILLVFMTPDNAVYIAFEILKESSKWNSYIKDVKWFYKTDDSISFCEDLLDRAGFQETECYLKKSEHRVASWKTFIELMKSVNPFLRYIPSAMKTEFIREFQELLKKQSHITFNDVDEEITVEYNLIVATAKKIKERK